jgi:tryptophan halogenase
MSRSPLTSVAILGGGVAGWMTAGALSRALPADCAIRVVETAGSAPRGALSTLPALRAFHGLLGLDEAALMRAARGTFKLGARYSGWTAPDQDGDHVEGFSDAGANLDGVAFHHHWLRARERGEVGRYEDYSLAAVAGRLGRFAPPSENPRSVLSTLSYGLHLDAAGYVEVLRSTAGRVERRVAEIAEIALGPDDRIAAVVLADGERIAADSVHRRHAGRPADRRAARRRLDRRGGRFALRPPRPARDRSPPQSANPHRVRGHRRGLAAARPPARRRRRDPGL